MHTIEQANRILEKYITPRYRALDKLEQWVSLTQYEGRPDWFSSDVPLLERAPSINIPIIANAIESNTDLCLGEQRWPRFTAFSSEDDTEFDAEFGLNEEDSQILQKFILRIEKQARLRTVIPELLDAAQGSGAAVAIACVQQGKLCVHTARAKWCTPTFDPKRPGVVIFLEIRYPYLQDIKIDGEWQKKCFLYRRTIDATNDTVYQPAEGRPDGREPTWTVDTNQSGQHGLGFCPVVWYRFLPGCSTAADFDGEAIHAGLLGMVDALNFALSQRNRGSLYAGDPMFSEHGVEEGEQPGAPGQRARSLILGPDGTADTSTVRGGGGGIYRIGSTGGASVRKKGPGCVWTYRNPQSRLELHALPGDALAAVDGNAHELEEKLLEALCVVVIDPDKAIGGDISGRAISLLFLRQTARCDKIRLDFGDNCILQLIDLLLRMASVVGSRSDVRLDLPGLAKTLPILQRFETAGDGATSEWQAPRLDLKWGQYFPATEGDKQDIVATAQAALDAGLITREVAVESLQGVFNIDDPEALLEAIEEEAAEKQASLHAAMAAMTAGPAEPDEDDAGATKPPVVPPPKIPFPPKKAAA